MPVFQVDAMDLSGKSVRELVDAVDQSTAIAQIKQKKLYVTNIREANARTELSDKKGKKLKLKELSVICRQLSTLLGAGVTVIKSLDVLSQQLTDKNAKMVIGQIYEGIQKGEMLSEAFRRQTGVFPDLLINMVAAGEESGTLDMVMDRMAVYFEKENITRNKVQTAMIYPIILLSVTIVVVIGLIVFVMPQFVGLLEEAGAELPLPTRILMGISNGIVNYWYIILAVIGIAAFLMYSWLKTPKGRYTWDSAKLTMPALGSTITAVVCGRFARNMSTLMSSGIQLIQCIEITSRVLGNKYFADNILNSKEDIRRGLQLSDALRRIDKLPPMVYNMVGIGEESGALDSILEKTANFYDEEADASIKKLVSMLEPMMIVVMGVLVGFIIVSIMMPMFQLYGNIG